MSRGKLLDVPGCLRSKLTVWKEDKFTALPGQGIKEREKRVAEWIAKKLLRSFPRRSPVHGVVYRLVIFGPLKKWYT